MSRRKHSECRQEWRGKAGSVRKNGAMGWVRMKWEDRRREQTKRRQTGNFRKVRRAKIIERRETDGSKKKNRETISQQDEAERNKRV